MSLQKEQQQFQQQQQKPLNQIPTSDADGDISTLADVLGGSGASDPNEGGEGDEQLTNVGGQAEDLRAATALHQPGFFNDAENQVALYRGIGEVVTGIGLIAGGTFVAVASDGALTLPVAKTIVGGFYDVMWGAYDLGSLYNKYQIQQDPFDPSYAQAFTPVPPSPGTTPTVPAGLPGNMSITLQQDYGTLQSAMGQAAEYANAIYITQNRLFSAYNSGDLASFTLQNNTLKAFVGQLAKAETAEANADTRVANDFKTLGVDVTLTQADVGAFQSKLKAQGLAALSQQQQAIIKAAIPNVSDQQALLMEMEQATPSSVPTSLVAMLKGDATDAAKTAQALTIPPLTDATLPPLPRGSHDQYVVVNNSGSLHVYDRSSGSDQTQTLASGNIITFTDGTGVFDPTGTAEDVDRLYSAALGRAPDVGGLQFWTSDVDGSHVPLSDVASSFAASPEFIHNYGSLSDAAFVQQLYQNVLNRPGEAGGVQFWQNALATGASRGGVLLDFAESPENEAKTLPTAGDKNNAEAYRLYQAALDRTPDQGGLSFWSSALKGGATPDQVAQSFIGSPEFQQKYGSLSASDFVSQLYQNVLHRAGDPGGQQFWTSQLQGGATQSSVLVGFSDSPENRLQTASATHDGWVFIHA